MNEFDVIYLQSYDLMNKLMQEIFVTNDLTSMGSESVDKLELLLEDNIGRTYVVDGSRFFESEDIARQNTTIAITKIRQVDSNHPIVVYSGHDLRHVGRENGAEYMGLNGNFPDLIKRIQELL